MSKIWDKGKELDALVERFTVGDDHILDLRLAAADAVASIAHAKMLSVIGVISDDEFGTLADELRKIIGRATAGTFALQ